MPAVTFTTQGALGKSALRQANERLVLNTIRRNRSVSRADIMRMTGLAPSSVTFIVNRLKREKLICEEKAEDKSPVGRQPTVLRLRPKARLAVGIEIALSGARLLLGDLNDTIFARQTVPWQDNYDCFFHSVHVAIRELVAPFAPGQVLGVGVGLPGFLDRETGQVVAAENFGWLGVEAGNLLRRQLTLPFHFENCAKLSAMAEMWFSERDSQPLRNFVSVAARGGLGTGIIIDGQILQGAFSAASEFGHTSVEPRGKRCACGNTGCWEQYASDLALALRYRESAGWPADEPLDSDTVLSLARAGDPVARRVVDETAYYVGIGFGNLIMALNPEAIVVSDYLAEHWDLLQETVWDVLRARIPSYYLKGVRIFASRHGADSSLMGAMAMVLSRYFSSFAHGKLPAQANTVGIRAGDDQFV